jgi:hypothetical protein
MIIKGGHKIIDIYHGASPIIEVYYGKYLIWTTIKSCFGAGYWVNEYPWSNSEGWRN